MSGSRGVPYMPGIDGLRAIAVVAVVIYHAAPGILPGGFLGVDVFFVISGYLITCLLLQEWHGKSTIDLGGFWLRRAKRLLPAVGVLLLGLLAFCVVFLPGEVVRLREDVVASAAYVTNWYLIVDRESYFESFGRPDLLRHLWSLAVEEQFYLIWPIVCLVSLRLGGAKAAIAVLAGGIFASTALMAALYEPGSDASRVYYGTDTRAAALLIGALLAFVWSPGRRGSRLLEVEAVIAAVGLVALFLLLKDSSDFLYRGGFLVTAAVTAVVVASLSARSALGRALSWGPLIWIGLRSYSIYLWHWPVIALTRPHQDVPIDGVPLFVFRMVLTLALAAASYRFVEVSARHADFPAIGKKVVREATRNWRGLGHAVAVGCAAGVVIALALNVAAADRPAGPPTTSAQSVQTVSWSIGTDTLVSVLGDHQLEREIAGAGRRRSETPTPSPAAETTTPAPASPPRTNVPVVQPTSQPTALPHPLVTPPPPPPVSTGTRIFAVGDSVMLGAVPQMQSVGNIEIDAAVSRQFSVGTDILAARRDAGTLGDIVVVHLGNNGPINAGQVDAMMGVLQGVHRVVFVNLIVPRDWEAPNNSVLSDAVSRYSSAVLVDWHGMAAGHPELFSSDGIHLRPEGAQLYASLVAQGLGG